MSAQAPLALLCLPCAGASASMYLRWRRFLPPSVRIVPVELPGRGARMGETFVEDFDALVARICTEQADAMRGDFALFGHSMGALLVHGVTRRLQSLRRPLARARLASRRRGAVPPPGVAAEPIADSPLSSVGPVAIEAIFDAYDGSVA